MQTDNVTVETLENGIAKVVLNRPHYHNCFNDEMISDLITIFENLQNDAHVRVMILTAKGKNFSAGADLNWMKKMISYTEEENLNDAKQLMTLLQTISEITKPIIGLAKGATMGGGIGLLCCCDIVIAEKDAYFCFSEVKLGLVPATIAPYVVRAIGARTAQYLFLTAKKFAAVQAKEIGIVHEIVEAHELDSFGLTMAESLLTNGPQALAAVKKLVSHLSKQDDQILFETAKLIAQVRVSKEAQEGLNAFFEKRQPAWTR